MLLFQDISFWNQSFEDLMKNNYSPNFIDSCIKSFLNKLYKPKVIVQNIPKKMFLLICRSWEVLCFKFERRFKNYLMINWRIVI